MSGRTAAMAEVALYTDYKSPFAYLAKDLAYALEPQYGIRIVWRHYTLNIPEYLDAVDTRTARNWRKVKYSYMDARRLANKRGLTVRGPRKIFDSSTAGIAMYFAIERGEAVFRAYHDRVFERFWKRELDLEDRAALIAVLAEAGADVAGFHSYVEGEGRTLHDRLIAEAEAAGVFGVPTFVYEGELFWGTDRIELLKERLAG